MLSALAGSFFLIAASGVQSVDPSLGDAPTIRKLPKKECSCPPEPEKDVFTLYGLVVDAEVTLAPDGRSANERQATIINLVEPDDDANVSAGERARVWHKTKSEQCGVTFDYGRKYKIPARKTEQGQFETDLCLMRQAGRLLNATQ